MTTYRRVVAALTAILVAILVATLGAIATPASVAAAPDDGSAQRIEFDAGTSGTSLSGIVAAGSVDRYVLGAQAGQRMVVTVSADTAVGLTVRSPSGSVLASGAPAFDGTLPESGDTTVEVTATGPSAAAYTLAVQIDPSDARTDETEVRFEPGSAGADLAGRVEPGGVDRYTLRAQAGQQMSVTVTGGATATLLGPDGAVLTAPGPSWVAPLPADGVYVVDVVAATAVDYVVTFRIVTAGSRPDTIVTAPPPPPSAPAAEIRLASLPAPTVDRPPVHPIVAGIRQGPTYLTDGRHTRTFPHGGETALAADGSVAVVGEDQVSTITLAGVVLTAPCVGCRGVAEHNGLLVTARDPQTGPNTFEIVPIRLTDLRPGTPVTATRTITAEQYPDNERAEYDVPIVIAADGAGVVVAYDYEPGGYNGRGGGQTNVARYDTAGTLVAEVLIPGSVSGSSRSPDGSMAALRQLGSSGACDTLRETAAIELSSLRTFATEDAGSPGGLSAWFQNIPIWDRDGALRTVGIHITQADGGDMSPDCGLSATPWQTRLDPATGQWNGQESPTSIRWLGPECGDAVTITPGLAGSVSVSTLTATLDGASMTFGAFDFVDLGTSPPPECTAGFGPGSAPT